VHFKIVPHTLSKWERGEVLRKGFEMHPTEKQKKDFLPK